MRIWKYGMTVLVLLIGCAFGPAHVFATPTQDVVNEISQASYTSYLDNTLYTHNGNNRGLGGAQHDPARTNIFNTFDAFGLSPSLDGFMYGGSTYYNVVGVHPGLVHPGQIYIVGAHYDSANNPGADDNASGVAGVLEAARVLSQHAFESTLVFIAFDREEQGLVGSKAYANAHKTDDIHAMISLDMIAYNPVANHDKAWLYSAGESTPFTQGLSTSLLTYGDITATIGGSMPYSDQAPFEALGFSGCLLIEYNWSGNPYYHRAGDSVDTLGYIDYEYATDMTRGVVGYLVDSAVLILVPEPTGLRLMGILLLVVRKRRS